MLDVGIRLHHYLCTQATLLSWHFFDKPQYGLGRICLLSTASERFSRGRKISFDSNKKADIQLQVLQLTPAENFIYSLLLFSDCEVATHDALSLYDVLKQQNYISFFKACQDLLGK